MIKKRFTITQDFEEHHRQIRDNGHIIMGCFIEPQAEPIVKLLNELHEENEQLKQSYIQLKHRHSLLHDECLDAECDRDSYHKDIVSLEKENEQLKDALNQRTEQCDKYYKENEQLKQQLLSINQLIDTKIKHYEHKPISAPVSQPMSVNFDYDVDRLARLSELQDLKKELKSE